jgi:hypothetical protein
LDYHSTNTTDTSIVQHINGSTKEFNLYIKAVCIGDYDHDIMDKTDSTLNSLIQSFSHLEEFQLSGVVSCSRISGDPNDLNLDFLHLTRLKCIDIDLLGIDYCFFTDTHQK